MILIKRLTALLILLATVHCGFVKYSINGTVPQRFIVTDYGNSRVLIWNTNTVSYQSNAQIVIGQPDMTTGTVNTGGSPGASNMSGPSGTCTDGVHIVVPDNGNNRVLIWNSFPTQNGQAADLVLGQPNMNSGTANIGGSVTAQTLKQPNSCLFYGQKLLVADDSNNRVLIWNSFPTYNQQPADMVLGQLDLNSGTAGTTDQIMKFPDALFISGDKLFVTEFNNHRVLIWNSFPTQNGQAANVVVGQATMFAGGFNTTASTLKLPQGALVYDGRLYVADRGNSRILIWNSVPTQNGQAADLVLGQTTMNAGAANGGGSPSSQTLSGPAHFFIDGPRFFVGDILNNRILVWNSPPTQSQQPADYVIGQNDFASVFANGGGSVSARVLTIPVPTFSNVYENGVWRSGGY